MIAFAACKKKDPPPVADEPAVIDSSLKCADIPPPPSTFGWQDTTINEDKNINAFFFNPANPNELIYVANGDVFGYNKMFCYNIPTKTIKYLGDNGNYIPQINNRGWVVFARSDYNIYKIKTNGDSLTQLTSDNISHDPKWNNNGTMILYFKSATGNFPSYVSEMDRNGNSNNIMPVEFANTAFARTNNRIAYLKSEGSTLSVYYKDLAANSETLITSAQGSAATFPTIFQNLTFDNKDENIYWSNAGGIFKYNLTSQRTENIATNCQNTIYARPVIARNADEMTMSCHYIKPISSTKLFHQYKAFKLDLNTREMREVRIFP